MEENGTLLTGATGFLGGELLARMLERPDETVYALVRAENDAKAQERLDAVVAALLGGETAGRARAVAVAGDVTEPGLGIDSGRRAELAARIGSIVHCAASISFTLGLEPSRAINVEGTRRVLEFGELCAERGGLDHLVHVSTAYVAGTHRGRFGEDDLDRGQGFRNGYEQSKFEAECLVSEFGDRGLPVQVVRPSIVVGDSRSGWTSNFNVLYSPMRAFSLGAFPFVPARRRSPVDVVPVDYVADAVLELRGRPGTTYNLTAGDQASDVAELIELATRYTGRRAPRLLPPLLYRRVMHPVLMRTHGKRKRRSLRRNEALFSYFAMRVRFDDSQARRALAPAGVEMPPLRTYFDRLMDFAESAGWGRDIPPRFESARASEAGAPVGPIAPRSRPA
ncbi:NAD-dependent epimerase/dehydratase family protein [Thermoleophilia bacterium SCSIO 60948]|nr:NAD-dependent epimerase/dehydratase family protein [Thermoleophilia bacterium SCSIO 60948]